MELYDIDWDAVKNGTIPWNVEDCIEVMSWYQNLHTTPKDDWDLREYNFSLKSDEKDEITHFQLNQFNHLNQLGLYMARRYDKLMPYHMDRLMKIFAFLRNYNEDLKSEEFIRIGDDGHEEICTFLLQALCELPYTKKIIVKNEEHKEFDYKKVVDRVHKLSGEE